MDREDLKSVKYAIGKDETVEKSLFSDLAFSTKISKTGAELKEMLKQYLVQNILRKNDLFRDLETIAQEVGELPQGKLEDWEMKGMRDRLTTIPYKYLYEQVYTNNAGQNQADPTKSKYNDILRNYIETSVDCLFIKTIIDNVEDKKKYEFSTEMATKLGF